jgi:protein TonB
MSRQSKATQISLLLHAVLILGGLLLSRYATTQTPPLVIDFSIATAEAATGEPNQPAGDEQQKPAGDEPAKAQPVVPPKEPQKELLKPAIKQPQKNKKPATAKPKTAKEAAKMPAQPAVEPTPEPAPAPKADAQPEESNAYVQAGTSQSDPAGSTAAASTAATASNQTAAGSQSGGAQPGGKHEGTGGGAGGGGKASYNFEYIRRLILNNLSFPATARKMGLTGKIVVSFLLREDGQVEDIAIVSGSGHEILDNNVVATIRRIAPFPRPPARAQLVLPIVYNLK